MSNFRKLALLSAFIACLLTAAALAAFMRVRGAMRRAEQALQEPLVFAVDGRALIARPKTLPDGSFVVQVVDSATGAVELEGSYSVNPFMRWALGEANGDVWLHSSDIGTLVYTKSAAGWEEVLLSPGQIGSSRWLVPEDVYAQMSSRYQVLWKAHRQP